MIAKLTWGASQTELGVEYYEVYVSAKADGSYRKVANTQALTYNYADGLPGTQYFFRVIAFDRVGRQSLPAQAGPVAATWKLSPHGAASNDGDTCRDCHQTHQAVSSTLMRSDLPTAPAGEQLGELTACYACHDGRGASTNIKDGPRNSFALASGHSVEETKTAPDLTNKCSSCHDPHQDSGDARMLPAPKVNGVTITATGRALCTACHNAANDWYKGTYPSTSAPTRNSAGYPVAGTWPGPVAYNGSTNAHRLIPETSQTVLAGSIKRDRGDCQYCHAAHRGAGQYDGLNAEFRPPSASTLATDQANGAYAALCLRCHGGAVPSGFTTAPADIKRFVTAAGDNAGHRIKTAGGTLPVGAPLPCYECHNPHGSRRANASMFSDVLGGGLSTAQPEDVRKYCFTCHTTSDTGAGWVSATSSYQPAVASDSIVGISRTAGLLKLPPVPAHAEDATGSCYSCHGGSYAEGGNNVHNPGSGSDSESAGGSACFGCHSYESMQSPAGNHHAIVSDDAGSYPVIADPSTLTADDTRRTCLTCHVDHDYFGPTNTAAGHTDGRAQNLRSSISVAPDKADGTTYRNYDYFNPVGGTEEGICISCHKVQLTKNTANRSTSFDQSSKTAPIAKDSYDLSAHNYMAGAPDLNSWANSSTFSDSSGFGANCAKCHNDTMSKSFQTSSNRFGTHDASTKAIQTNGDGQPVGSDPQEAGCYLCHSRAFEAQPSNPRGGNSYFAIGSDFYGGGLQMGQMQGSALNIKGMFSSTGSRHPVDGAGGSNVECANCHNPHKAEFNLGFGGPSGTVQDPDNTLVGSSMGGDAVYYSGATDGAEHRTNTDYCLTCHDGAAPTQVNDGARLVPYTVTIDAARASRANKLRFAGRSHFNGTASETSATALTIAESCPVCHDKHASKVEKLLGNSTAPGADPTINGSTVAGNDNSVCFACHTGPSTSFPAGEAQRRSADGYLMSGTWPGSLVYSDPNNGIHRGVVGGTGTSLPNKGAGDCKTCHDVHGTANPYDETLLPFASQDYTLCFDCHDDAPGTNIKALYPESVGGTSTDPRSGHRVVSDTSALAGATLDAGDATPCYDCHNPHGSASAYGLQVRDIGDEPADAFDLSTAGGVREFCFACHLTSDTREGWNGTGYAAVTPGVDDTVEGVTRDSASFRLLLPANSEHVEAANSSCYDCHTDPHTPQVSVGASHAFSSASDYDNGTQSGCTNSGAGCHDFEASYSDFTVYHPETGCGTGACHTSSDFATFKATYNGDATCEDCHNDNFAGALDVVNVNAARPDGHYTEAVHQAAGMDTVMTAGGTASATCSNCHSTLDMTGMGQLYRQHQGLPAPYGDTTCYDCHNQNAQVTNVIATSWPTKQCSECHSIGVLPTMVAHSTTAPPAVTAMSPDDCLSGCHGTEGNLHDLHKDAPGGCSINGCHDYSKQAAKPTRKTCGTGGACHTADPHQPQLHTASVASSGECLDCHTDADIASLHNAGCATCHDNAAYPALPTGRSAECTNCHNPTVVGTKSYTPVGTAHYVPGNHVAEQMDRTIVYSAVAAEPAVTVFCTDCHSAALDAAHTATSVGNVSCAMCHTQESPVNAVRVITELSWSARTCGQCHATPANGGNGPGVHGTFNTGHTASSPQGCGGSGANCHNTFDLRSLHQGVGCKISGCHSVDKNMTGVGRTCGQGGTCHVTYTTTNHKRTAAVNHFSNLTGTSQGITYSVGSNVGCTKDGTNQGCHYADLRLEHGPLTLLDASKGGGRTMSQPVGSSPDRCTICHDTPGNVAGTYATTAAINSAITNGDKRCTACHGAPGGPLAPHADATGFKTGVNSPQLSDWQWPTTAGGSAHNSYPGMGQTTINATGNIYPKSSFTIGATTYSWAQVTSAAFVASTTYANPRTGAQWKAGDAVYCNDCHVSTNANGPQGASVPMPIDPAYSQTAYNTPTTGSQWSATGTNRVVCLKCHLAGGNNPHGNHSGRAIGNGGACTDCHNRYPHAWKRPRLLGYVDDPEVAYRSGNRNSNGAIGGLRRIQLTNYTTGLTNSGNCADQNCKGTANQHSNTFTAWP